MEDGTQTVEAANPAAVPGGTQVEFGAGRNLDPKAQQEMNALEAQIAAALQGKPQQEVQPPAEVKPVYQAPPAPAPVIPAPQVAPPEAPQAIAPPPGVQVPVKFQNPDGSLNVQRLEKSTQNVADALGKYAEMERELSRLRQGQSAFGQPQGVPFQGQPQYAPDPAQAFEQRLAQDLQNNPAQTILHLHRASLEAARAEAMSEVQGIKRDLELRSIAESDPSVFTAEGIAKLMDVRKANPWIDASPTPWTAAYYHHLGKHGPIGANSAPQSAQNGHQQAPPQPARPPAPVVGGGQNPPTPAAPINLTTADDLRQHLSSKFAGLPADKRYQAEVDYLDQVLARAASRR